MVPILSFLARLRPASLGILGILLVSIGFLPTAAAQTSDVRLTAERRPVEVGIEPAVQRVFDGGNVLEQQSASLWLSVPLGASTQVWARTHAGRTTATGLAALSGWGDTQVGLAATWSIGGSSLVANVSGNLPTGRSTLRAAETRTSALLSQQAFGIRMPSFGQGWGARSGLTLAVPIGETVMLGLGGAYHYLAPYTPLDGIDAAYAPSNEVLVASGFDVRFSERVAWSTDLAYTLYGVDQLNGLTVFEPGDRWTITSQLRLLAARRDLRILSRYTGQGRSLVPAPTGVSFGALEVQALPASFLTRADLSLTLSRTFRVLLNGGVVHYGSTDAQSIAGAWNLSAPRTVAQVGAGASVRLGPLRWRPQVDYAFGSLQSLSVRAALLWRQ
jgi:hypothetical protein